MPFIDSFKGLVVVRLIGQMELASLRTKVDRGKAGSQQC